MVRACIREAVLARDKYRCTKCGTYGTNKNKLTMHHVIYRSKGGKDTLDNLITLCESCHRELHKLYG